MGDFDQTSSPEILAHFGPFTLGGGVPFLSLLSTLTDSYFLKKITLKTRTVGHVSDDFIGF